MGHTESSRVIQCEYSVEGERCMHLASYIIAAEDQYAHLYEVAVCDAHVEKWKILQERIPAGFSPWRYRFNTRLI